MNKAPWIFGSIALLTTVAAYGCGNSTNAGTTTTAGTGGHAATSSSHAATTGTTSTTATSGTGGGAGGSAPAPMPACMAPAKPPSNGSCFKAVDAGGAGGGMPACNPFTAAECDTAAGETCDTDGTGFFCFPPPPKNDVALCGDCGSASMSGDFCAVGLTCIGKCAAFCCDDGDCGTAGKCDKTLVGDPDVGICVL
jgi:hypothetical protein